MSWNVSLRPPPSDAMESFQKRYEIYHCFKENIIKGLGKGKQFIFIFSTIVFVSKFISKESFDKNNWTPFLILS